MKILNLYAGIGGNRKNWGNEYQITAVEYNPQIAAIYQELYPEDKVIIADAHDYLLNYFEEYDFIWTSPPCQTHSSFRQNIAVRFRGTKPAFPDMKLYEEIIFLQHNFKGSYVVENVNPYYKPLIPPTFELDRHFFSSDKFVFAAEFQRPELRSAQIAELEKALGFDLSQFKLPNKRQVLRNCVLPDVGKYILDSVI